MKERRSITAAIAKLLSAAFLVSLAYAADTPPTKLVPSSRTFFRPAFYAQNRVLPELDTVTFDRTFVLPGVAVEYKYDVFVEGELYGTSTGAPLRFALPDGWAGKKAVLRVSYRKNGDVQFAMAESFHVNVAPAALFTQITNTTLTASEPLHIGVYRSLLQRTVPPGTIVHVEDDQEGRFFNTNIDAAQAIGGIEYVVPMRKGANVAVPTIIVIRISSDSPNQIDDEQVLKIVPRKGDATAYPSVRELEDLPLAGIVYEKAVICALSQDECSALAQGLRRKLQTLRNHPSASSTDTIVVRPASCIAVWRNGEVKIVKLYLTTSVARSSSRMVLDKKTGETFYQTEVMQLETEEADLRGAKLDAVLQSVMTEGPNAGKTFDAVLRSTACLK